MTEMLRFVHISDTHTHPDPDFRVHYVTSSPLPGTKALIEAVNALPFMPDFILHTGDVAIDPIPDIYPQLKAMLSQLKAPVHYLVGNHDDSASVQTHLMERSTDAIQPYPYYDFEVKGVHFVCIDSNGPHNPENPSGNVVPEQLEWLDAICRSDDERPLVIAVHHNVVPVGTPWLDDWMRIENGEELHAIIRQARDRLRGVFHGHIHQNLDVLRDGVLYSSVVSSWYQLNSYTIPEDVPFPSNDDAAQPGFNVVTITPERTSIRRHSFDKPTAS